MALPKQPGLSYQDMYRLILFNRVQMLKEVFTIELLVAICWEETLFNNIKQDPGTAVGFGQTEPSEFWTLETNDARAKGYHVPALPRRYKVKTTGSEVVTLAGKLSDEQSIQVMSASLCHLYLNLNRSLQAALEGYGGVRFSKNIDQLVQQKKLTAEKAKKIDPLGVAGRLEKIQGWRKCERILLHELPHTPGDGRPVIRQALHASRAFPKNDATWNKILFPEDDKDWV